MTGRRRNRGLSLVELMVAMLILAVGFLAVLSIFPTAFISVHQSKNHLIGSQLAQAYMDTERAKAFNSMAGATTVDQKTVVVNGVSHQVPFATVVTINPSGVSGINKATITVTTQWQQPLHGGGTNVRSVTLEAARTRGIL